MTFDPEALIEAVTHRWGSVNAVPDASARRHLYRLRAAGPMTATEADRQALRFGYMPFEIWGDAWFDLPDGACDPRPVLRMAVA